MPGAEKQTGQKRGRVGDGTPGPGRPKGIPNKNTTLVKEAIQKVFDGIGGVEAMTTWANAEPGEFYKIYARLIPTEVKAEGDFKLTVQVVRFGDDPPTS